MSLKAKTMLWIVRFLDAIASLDLGYECKRESKAISVWNQRMMLSRSIWLLVLFLHILWIISTTNLTMWPTTMKLKDQVGETSKMLKLWHSEGGRGHCTSRPPLNSTNCPLCLAVRPCGVTNSHDTDFNQTDSFYYVLLKTATLLSWVCAIKF